MAELEAAAFALAAEQMLHRLGTALQGVLTDDEFARSQELVPVDTAALKDSGKVSDVAYEGDSAMVVISYGNPDDPTGIYAIVVHERLDTQHPNGGQAKYLEAPVLEGAPTLVERVAARARNG